MVHRRPGARAASAIACSSSQLEYVCSSKAAASWLAENYVGAAPVYDPAGRVAA